MCSGTWVGLATVLGQDVHSGFWVLTQDGHGYLLISGLRVGIGVDSFRFCDHPLGMVLGSYWFIALFRGTWAHKLLPKATRWLHSVSYLAMDSLKDLTRK